MATEILNYENDTTDGAISTTKGKKTKNNGFEKILKQELMALEGLHSQHPETGAGIDSGKTYIKQYTNRIFGAPYQFLDSVDRRFASVNPNVGSEYLRNIILNSPILHIKPGMPIYTGGASSKSIATTIGNLYGGVYRISTGIDNGMNFVEALLTELARDSIFGKGSRLQKRMYGFRETYNQYISHVNYMCRSMAVFLELTQKGEGQKYPTGTYINDNNKFRGFANMEWQRYRMLTKTKYMTPTQEAKRLMKATLIGAAATTIGQLVKSTSEVVGATASAVSAIVSSTYNGDGVLSSLFSGLDTVGNSITTATEDVADTASESFDHALNTTLVDILVDKVCSVLFMVQPGPFEESLSNETSTSAIESTIDQFTEGVGAEIAFITGSNSLGGIAGNTIEGITNVLGDTVESAGQFLQGLVEPLAGGFVTNLFSGAMNSIKGQKMIYPKIYKKSESSMDYNFTVKLTTPYGDPYNYYMNIIVPLMHLIALAAPRMMTSNAIASPYLVQAFIPGMCTCQLGIIKQMSITKNPDANHVSVQGFPLTIEVKFQIEELYNALSISPANDPASFLFNETLNDYMANLAGLQPSRDTYKQQQLNTFMSIEKYFNNGDWYQDWLNSKLMGFENMMNPFLGK